MDDELESKEEQKEERRSRLWYLGGFIFVTFVLLLTIGGVILSQTLPKEIPETPLPTIIPPPSTPTPSFLPSSWHMEVLNGSGIKGSATVVSQKLRNEGFVVDQIGNAETSGLQKSLVRISQTHRSDVEDFMKHVVSVLPQATYSGELLSSTFSAQITVGLLDSQK